MSDSPAALPLKLPVTVIGGYLGAGKTTLINHLLRDNGGLRLAVLVNEFGELAIDADLIEAEEDGLIALSGGCVCCAFGSDLMGALETVKAMDPPPDHVLIEASGVALPAAIAATVGLVAGLRADATVVLADAEQVRRNAADTYLGDTITRQIAQADILILTKADLVDEPALADLAGWIRGIAPTARILPAIRGQVPAAALLGALPLPRRGGDPGAGAHGAFASAVLTPDGLVDADALARSLAADPGVTRAKGFAETATGPVLIHVVGHRADVEPAAPGHPPGIVCIGLRRDLDCARLTALLADTQVPG